MNVFGKSSALPWAALSLSAWLAGCGAGIPSGPLQVKIIQPTGPSCAYTIAPAQLQTLESLTEMRGLIGRVVTSRENLGRRPEILDQGLGLNPIDGLFSHSRGVYSPLDLDTLFAASLYYAIERAHFTFAELDPMANMVATVPGFKDITMIVHDARRTFGTVGVDPEVKDNAEFLPHQVSTTGTIRNYLISYPTHTVSSLPLGLNLGIMAHEYGHLVFNYLFYEKAFARNARISTQDPTERTVQSLDEGLADYFGFLASKDPSFFLCSYPSQVRDLAQPKSFTRDYRLRLETGPDDQFDSHEGGAIFASINYEIGRQIGFDVNGRLLIRLMSYLLDCPSTSEGSNTIRMNFQRVASCHAALADSAAAGTIRATYNRYLDSYGGI